MNFIDMHITRSEKNHQKYIEELRKYFGEDEVVKAEYERKCEKLLLELGIMKTYSSFMELLLDDKKLREVVSKLKMKAFW